MQKRLVYVFTIVAFLVPNISNAQETDCVEINIKLPDGEIKKLSAKFLIGCDGGRSTVRKSQGIDFPGFTWEERFLILASYFDYESVDNYRYRNYIAGLDTWCSVFKIPGPEGKGMWRNLFPVVNSLAEKEILSNLIN